MASWYYMKDGRRIGPIDGKALKRVAASGALLPTDQVWTDGQPVWIPASSVRGLFPAAPDAALATMGDSLESLAQAATYTQTENAGRPNRRSVEPRRRNVTAWLIGFVAVLLLAGGAIYWMVLTPGGPDHNIARMVETTLLPSGKSPQGSPPARAASIDLETFKELYRIAKRIEGAQEAGLKRGDFATLLQEFATALSIAKDNVATDQENKVLDLYRRAFEIWKDSAALWDETNAMPQRIGEAEKHKDMICNVLGGAPAIDEIQKCQTYSLFIGEGKLPIQSYLDKKPTAAADLAERYKLPVEEQEAWKYIRADSYKKLWQRAGKVAGDANRLAKGK